MQYCISLTTMARKIVKIQFILGLAERWGHRNSPLPGTRYQLIWYHFFLLGIERVPLARPTMDVPTLPLPAAYQYVRENYSDCLCRYGRV
jgi:hypothetical protein